MGLVRAILTRSEYEARIAALAEKHSFLRNPGSSIRVMPGLLGLIENLVAELNVLGNGSIEFMRVDKSGSSEEIKIFVESSLAGNSGRREAISFEINKFRNLNQQHSICKYCGAELSEAEISEGGSVCRHHNNIFSGWYADEIEYVNETEADTVTLSTGIYIKPDPVELSLEVFRELLTPLFDVHYDAAVVIEEAVSLITKHRWKREMVLKSEFSETKAKLLESLEKAFSKMKEEPMKPVNVDTTGRVRPTLEMYKMSDVEEMWKKSQSRDRKQLLEPYYKAMKDLGTARHFALVSEAWREELDALGRDFPNFEDAGVIDFLRQQFALAEMGDGRVHFPPILLNGPAGVGKTYLAQTCANMVKTSYAEIHMESEQNGASLVGASAFWSNANPGKIADVLLLKEAANPFVVVDELDKAAGDARYDPLSGLYSLLEPGTAKTFEDLCLGFPMNASGICWVFTSNEMKKIPLPILSRLKVFEVAAPTKEQTEQIARRIYAALLKSHWGKAFDPELPGAVVRALGQREPRVIRNTLLAALGNAAIDKRTTLEVKDLDGALPHVAAGNYQQTRIGFAQQGN
jgi:ATP-dependent Lon protease